LDTLVALDQPHVGDRDAFGKARDVGVDFGHAREISITVDVGRRRNVEAARQVTVFNHAVMANNATVADRGVEDHAVEADEDFAAEGTRAVHDGAMGDRGVLADRDLGTGLGVDDHAILDVGIRADHNRFDVAVVIDLISTDHCVRSNKHVLGDDHVAADDGGRINEGALVDSGEVAGRVASNHSGGEIADDPRHASQFTATMLNDEARQFQLVCPSRSTAKPCRRVFSVMVTA
jgi:hypothetical protein